MSPTTLDRPSSSQQSIDETLPLLGTRGQASTRMEALKTLEAPVGREVRRRHDPGAAGELSDDELHPSASSGDMSEERWSEVERRLVRKLDLLLLPPLWLLYVCNYLDRNNIA